jgi:hypothetical protein
MQRAIEDGQTHSPARHSIPELGAYPKASRRRSRLMPTSLRRVGRNSPPRYSGTTQVVMGLLRTPGPPQRRRIAADAAGRDRALDDMIPGAQLRSLSAVPEVAPRPPVVVVRFLRYALGLDVHRVSARDGSSGALHQEATASSGWWATSSPARSHDSSLVRDHSSSESRIDSRARSARDRSVRAVARANAHGPRRARRRISREAPLIAVGLCCFGPPAAARVRRFVRWLGQGCARLAPETHECSGSTSRS